jgi:alginate O-acetyltransferase complex protein AlgI
VLFSSPIFLFAFLPISLLSYYIVPPFLRNPTLLALSVIFYLWGESAHAHVLLISIAITYLAGLRLERASRSNSGRLVLGAAIAGNLFLLITYKYVGFLRGIFMSPHAASDVALPLGISFFVFHSISYLVDVYLEKARSQQKLGKFSLYIVLFPQLIAGPIVRYQDVAEQLSEREHSINGFVDGIERFILGLGKKTFIANSLGSFVDGIFQSPPETLSCGTAWLGVASYGLQLYMDFSGYSDMAIGLSLMFGFRIRENFYYPYAAQSVQQFWQRWHISLSTWFRDYLYIPLGGNRHGEKATYRNLVIVFALCGLWHGAQWSFVFWGLYHGLFLVLERAFLSRWLEQAWRPMRHAYLLLVVTTGWVFFRSPDLIYAWGYLSRLVDFRMGSATCTYMLANVWNCYLPFVILVACISSVPTWEYIAERTLLSDQLQRGTGSRAALRLSFLAAVLILSSSWLAAGTYNPFIYFRF